MWAGTRVSTGHCHFYSLRTFPPPLAIIHSYSIMEHHFIVNSVFCTVLYVSPLASLDVMWRTKSLGEDWMGSSDSKTIELVKRFLSYRKYLKELLVTDIPTPFPCVWWCMLRLWCTEIHRGAPPTIPKEWTDNMKGNIKASATEKWSCLLLNPYWWIQCSVVSMAWPSK